MWTKTFEDGVLKLWAPDRPLEEAPNVIQPFNPDGGEAWDSEAQAMEWGDAEIYRAENPPVYEVPAEEAPADPAAPAE